MLDICYLEVIDENLKLIGFLKLRTDIFDGKVDNKDFYFLDDKLEIHLRRLFNQKTSEDGFPLFWNERWVVSTDKNTDYWLNKDGFVLLNNSE